MSRDWKRRVKRARGKARLKRLQKKQAQLKKTQKVAQPAAT